LTVADASATLSPLEAASRARRMAEYPRQSTVPPVATPLPVAATKWPLPKPPARRRRLFRRFLTVAGQLLGLLAGGLVAYVRSLPPEWRRRQRFLRWVATLAEYGLDPALAPLPFAAQFRCRLERLGPTYIKLGQIMAVREDMLPHAITDELKHLFDEAPAVAFPVIRALIEAELGRPLAELFQSVEEQSLGSASLAQVHRAFTRTGQSVVIKVLKPGVRETVLADLKLLSGLGRVVGPLMPQYEIMAIIEEFRDYTVRELDLTVEADNGDLFSAQFHDTPAIVFPTMYREFSTASVLTMEFLDGFKPGAPATFALDEAQRLQVVNLGAEAILRMLYQHGFFHADLHAGNLLILPGPTLRVGFIDLGMVGRFEEQTRRLLLYYYHALVNGDVEKAAQHLCAIARPGPGGSDLAGFRRSVVELSRRFLLRVARGQFSIARLILESMRLGGRHRMYFRVDLVLMVKALVTFEGVGRMVDPDLDVVAVSRTHIERIFRAQFQPARMSRELWRHGPELLDLVGRLPELLAQSGRQIEGSTPSAAATHPLVGLRSAIVAAACILGGVLILAQTDAWLMGSSLLLAGGWIYWRGG